MRKLRTADVFLSAWMGGLALLIGYMGCTAGERQAARTALDVAQYACIIAHAELADDYVQKACGIADELIPVLKQILSAERVERAKMGCRTSPLPDGGHE